MPWFEAILYSRLELLVNFNLANTCVPHTTPLWTIMCAIMYVCRACVFGGINFGDLVKKFANLPN